MALPRTTTGDEASGETVAGSSEWEQIHLVIGKPTIDSDQRQGFDP
jgi:hypothetical protein